MATLATSNISVFGIFSNKLEVENCLTKLKNNSFRNSDISVLMPNPEGSQQFAHEKKTKAPEGAAAGAGGGAVIGGALGWLAGIGTLAIPAVGPFIAAGPLLALLSGAAIGGALGSIAGSLIGLGIPEYEAKRYEGFIKKGGILMSVHADDRTWADKAEGILHEAGAREVSRSAEAKSADARASM